MASNHPTSPTRATRFAAVHPIPPLTSHQRNALAALWQSSVREEEALSAALQKETTDRENIRREFIVSTSASEFLAAFLAASDERTLLIQNKGAQRRRELTCVRAHIMEFPAPTFGNDPRTPTMSPIQINALVTMQQGAAECAESFYGAIQKVAQINASAALAQIDLQAGIAMVQFGAQLVQMISASQANRDKERVCSMSLVIYGVPAVPILENDHPGVQDPLEWMASGGTGFIFGAPAPAAAIGFPFGAQAPAPGQFGGIPEPAPAAPEFQFPGP